MKLKIGAVLAAFVVLVALFAWATLAGAAVMGIVARKGDVSIEPKELSYDNGKLVISKVVAPADSFVVVYLADGDMPGKRVAAVPIKAGVTTDLEVPLSDKKGLTPDLIAAVYIDRGKRGEFEFNMKDPAHSPDRPYFVDGKEVAAKFKAAEFGVKAAAGEAAIEVADQPGVTDTLIVKRAVAPTAAWVVVHLDDKGMPGKRVGVQQIAAGENADVKVALDPSVKLTGKLLVAVHADRGTSGRLEFDMMDKLNSPDQPFFVGGKEVATAVTVR
ncbi:MAG TPA: hypothetical protein VGK50_06020 [Coriobacteriia bacterium]|jgi:hypothetical protein